MGTSPLDQIKSRHAQITERLATTAIPVPLWDDPHLYLRVTPLEAKVIDRLLAPVEKAGRRSKTDAMMRACASVIGMATVKVLVGDDPENGTDGPGQAEIDLIDMRPALELPEDADSVATIRAMCFTDGYVIKVANAILDHSGYGGERIEEAFLGD